MTELDKALATQLANIAQRSGKSLAELKQIVRQSGLAKHGEMVTLLKTTLAMGHGDANTVVHLARQPDAPDGAPARSAEQVLDQLYAGPKQALRPIHEALLAALQTFGSFDTAPKQSYVSYRRKKQFAMIGPATQTQVEVGLNMQGVAAADRLLQLPAGQMCNYELRLGGVQEVDAELIAWLRTAYAAAA